MDIYEDNKIATCATEYKDCLTLSTTPPILTEVPEAAVYLLTSHFKEASLRNGMKEFEARNKYHSQCSFTSYS